MAKETGLIFVSESIPRLLDGSKTMTRRVIAPQPELNGQVWTWQAQKGVICQWKADDLCPIGNMNIPVDYCPFGGIGDRIWVKEAWACGTHMGQLVKTPKELGEDMWVAWKENYNDDAPALKQLSWKSPRFMPKKYARIWREITSVKVERVQEISKEDAEAEGIKYNPKYGWLIPPCIKYEPFPSYTGSARLVFRDLWDSRNAKCGYGWEANPWVWGIEFKRLSNG